MNTLFDRLRKRNVFRVAATYLIAAWVIIQLVAVMMGALELPSWVDGFILLLLVIGFIIALVFAWIFDLGPDGITVTSADSDQQPMPAASSRDYLLIAGLSAVLAFNVYQWLGQSEDEAGALLASSGGTDSGVLPALEDLQVDSQPAPISNSVLPNSIAVLPLENLSPNPDDSYFAASIHEEILNRLARNDQLNVIARTTMRQYEQTTKAIPEIARELNVQTIMEGSVRFASNRVRVSLQLNDAINGVHLWAEIYERTFDDIFAIETDIALQVAAALNAEFSLSDQADLQRIPTDSADAYALYLAAQVHLGRSTDSDIGAGAEKIDQALVLDPEFLGGWILKSAIYRRFPVFLPERAQEGREVSEQAALRALELDSASIEARSVLGSVLIEQGRWLEAESQFRTVPEAERNLEGYGWLQFLVGQPGKSHPMTERQLRKDPLDMEGSAFYIAVLDASGDVSASLAAYQRGLPLFEDWSFGRFHVSGTLLGAGDLGGFLALPHGDTPIEQDVLALLRDPENAADRLHALVEAGTYEGQAEKTWLMYVAAYLGESGLALTLLEEMALKVPANAYHFSRPIMAGVRQLPEFRTLVKTMGLVDYWQVYGWPAYCQPSGTDDFTCR